MIEDSALSEKEFQELMNDPNLFSSESITNVFDTIFKPMVSAKTAESALKMANTELARQIIDHQQGGAE